MLEIKAIVRRIKSTSSFPSSTVVENPLPMQEIQRQGFDPWVRKVPWSRKGNLVQYSCLENSMERGVWWAIVHGVAESNTMEAASLSLSLFLNSREDQNLFWAIQSLLGFFNTWRQVWYK